MTPAFVPLIEDGKEVVRVPRHGDLFLRDGELIMATFTIVKCNRVVSYPIYARVDSLELAKPDIDTQCKIAFADMWLAFEKLDDDNEGDTDLYYRLELQYRLGEADAAWLAEATALIRRIKDAANV